MKLETISTQAEIATERLVLRAPRKSDAGALSLYRADERVAKATTLIPHPLPPGSTESFLERVMDPEGSETVWIIDSPTDASEGRARDVLGMIRLNALDRGQAELSYWVAPAFWNTGVASEAVRGLIAANPLECQSIFASVFQDNPASARVLTNAGFEYVGDAEAFSVARGANVPTWTYILKLA